MNVSIHQKILLRKVLSKHGVNANKLLTQVNSNYETVRKAARKQIAFLVSYCTGKGILFTLNNPYSQSFKHHMSSLNDGEPRHNF
jgi:hypothetical protein